MPRHGRIAGRASSRRRSSSNRAVSRCSSSRRDAISCWTASRFTSSSRRTSRSSRSRSCRNCSRSRSTEAIDLRGDLPVELLSDRFPFGKEPVFNGLACFFCSSRPFFGQSRARFLLPALRALLRRPPAAHSSFRAASSSRSRRRSSLRAASAPSRVCISTSMRWSAASWTPKNSVRCRSNSAVSSCRRRASA